MADQVIPRVKVPASAKAGDVFTIKTLINHPMVTGFTKDKDGKPIPREIINRFTCDFNGANVIDIELDPAVSANPYFEFDAKIDKAGDFTFTWYDDNGQTYTDKKTIALG